MCNEMALKKTKANICYAQYATTVSTVSTLPKKDHRHLKARRDKFFDYYILPTSYIARYLSTYNADLEEIERPTSRGTGKERDWER